MRFPAWETALRILNPAQLRAPTTTTMALNTCELEAADISNVLADQNPILRNEMINYLALEEPFLNLMDGGTVENNIGEEIKTLVTSRTVLNKSLTEPEFTNLAEACLLGDDVAEHGSTEFTTQLQIDNGRGPNICVNQARHKVVESFRIQTENLKSAIKTYIAADNRGSVVRLSGLKAVAYAGGNPWNTTNGGYNQVSAAFPNDGLPTSDISFKYVKGLTNRMRDEFSPELFGTGSDAHFVLSGGTVILDKIREETGFKADLHAVVSGGFSDARKALERYAFIDYNVRGLKFAIDQQPLRFNEVDGNGYPVWIEPLVRVSTDYGVEARVNPDWVNALHEAAMLWSKGAFKRLVPKSYLGEPGSQMKFPAQMYFGEIQWHNVIDNTCNPWGDIGWHKWRIARAFQARRPHGVIPILFKRCNEDYGLDTCEAFSSDLVV